MADKMGEAMLAGQAVEGGDRLAQADDQGQTLVRQRGAQIGQAFGDKLPLAGRGVGAGPERGFDDIDRQDPPQPCGQRQGRMVGQAQVALQPDENIHGTRM